MNAFVHRPQSVWLRRALFQIHLWVGIAAGLYIVVSCVTGSVLVFRIEIQRALYPRLFTPGAPGPVADAAAVVESVRAAYPRGRLGGVDAPTVARPTYLAYVTVDARSPTVLLDPVTAAVLGELPDHSWLGTLQELHFDLLAGRPGRIANGLGGLLILVLCGTGLVIWWPGIASWRRAFVVDVRRGWRRINWDLHSATGVWSLVLIAMWAATGAYYGFPRQFRALINAVAPLSANRAPQSTPPAGDAAPGPSARALIDEARRHMPNHHLARIVPPTNDRGAFQVMFSEVQPTPVGVRDLIPVYLDQHTGALLGEPRRPTRTTGDAIVAWIGPLHFGSFGGTGVKILWCVVGIAPPLLFVTGFIMWWTRVVRPRWLRAGPRVDSAGGLHRP